MTKEQPDEPAKPVVSVGTDDLIFQKIISLLTPFNHKGISIQRETAIMADMEIDSVAVFDLIMEVEDTYDITFPMETVSEMKSVGDLVDTIRSLKNA